MKSKRTKKKQGGFTLVELTMVVVVIAAVLGIIVSGKSLLAWWNGKAEGDLLSGSMSCARITWQAANFNGITLATLVNNNCFPDPSVTNRGTAAATANNAFGTAYTVAAGTVNTANDAVVVTSRNVPRDSCQSAVRGANTVASVITVNGVVVKAAGAGINDATLSTQCSANDVNTIAVSATKVGA